MATYTHPSLNQGNQFVNAQPVLEDNFSVVPDDTYIWKGELPFEAGDVFPTQAMIDRASIYKRNEKLYRGDHEGVYDDMMNSFNDFQRDAITNYQIFKLIPNLPDHRIIADTWVDLLGAKPPKIDGGDTVKISTVSSVVGASNFATAYQRAIRGSLVMYGNAVFKVDRQKGGNPKVSEVPIKCWLPFVNESDLTTIDVNCVFNICEVEYRDGRGAKRVKHICEFLLYYEDGKVEKITHEYSARTGKLGREIDREESQAFDGAGISPIVVFTGSTLGNTIYGEDAFKKWDAAIASCIRAYSTIFVLLERAKEIYRVIPEGATQRDENTGVTFMQQTGAIMYKNLDKAPEVKIILAEIGQQMTAAVSAYKEALARLSRDTDLAYALFDPEKLGTQMSAKALKTTMYRTELRAKSMATTIAGATKLLIVKIALSKGVEIDISEFSLLTESGFVQDIETLTEIIQKRNGGAVTISREDSVSRLDDVTMAEATAAVRQLDGLAPVKHPEASATDSGEESEVSDLSHTHESTGLASPSAVVGSVPASAYPVGGGEINA